MVPMVNFRQSESEFETPYKKKLQCFETLTLRDYIVSIITTTNCLNLMMHALQYWLNNRLVVVRASTCIPNKSFQEVVFFLEHQLTFCNKVFSTRCAAQIRENKHGGLGLVLMAL